MKVVLITGPIEIEFLGRINIFGASFENQRLKWNSKAPLPIEFDELSKIKFLGQTSTIFTSHNLKFSELQIGTWIWNNVYDHINQMKIKKILVIGPINSGKSSFSLYLANRFIRSGYKTVIIDGDVGQGDLAPPTCIGSALIKEQTIDISLLKPQKMYFIGDIQPSKHVAKIASSINKLLQKSSKFDKCIINTDGFISGYGLDYKSKLIDRLRPDIVVCMDNKLNLYDLRVIMNSKKNYFPKWILVKSPSIPIKRTKQDRNMKRLSTCLRFFEARYIHKLEFDFNNHSLLQLNEVDGNRKKYKVLYNNQMFISNGEIQAQYDSLNCKLRNSQFVALGNGPCKGLVHGFGFIEKSNDKKAWIYATSKDFECIYLSNMIQADLSRHILKSNNEWKD